MNHRYSFRARAIRMIPVALLAVFLGEALTPTNAQAARIHARMRAARSTGASNRSAWARYLSGGPERWATTRAPAIPSGARLPLVNGGLLQTPFVDYLLWRRDLNPTRFDANHPNVARVFSQLVALPPIEAASSAGVTQVPAPDVQAVVPANPVAQVITPEPGSLAIAATFLGGLALWKTRRNPTR